MYTGPGFDDLNAIRHRVLRMPIESSLHPRYRNLRRAVAKITEDIRRTHGTTADVRRVEESIRRLRMDVEIMIP